MTDNAAEAHLILRWITNMYETADDHLIEPEELRADLTIATRQATTHALLAIAQALTPAGTCTAINRVTWLANPNGPDDTSTYTCRHPYGHTGAHQDPSRNSTWLDTHPEASHLGEEPQDNPERPCYRSEPHPAHLWLNQRTATQCPGHQVAPTTCGAFRPTADDNGDYPCILKPGHNTDRGTMHTDTDGDQWPITPEPPTCGHTNPDNPNMHCTDVPHHYGVHDHNRFWWINDTYPSGAGACRTRGCTLYNGHPGDHHIVPRPDHTEDVPW